MSMTFKTNLVPDANNSKELGSSSAGWKITKLNIPTTSGGSTYGAGTAGQALLSNGTTIYWGTISSSDTKNTAGSTDISTKIFLIGASSQAANPQTYSDNQVYVTNGQLDANKVRVGEHVTLQFNSTTNALDFVFA